LSWFRHWNYFSPSAMRVLEWGHYFGVPSVAARVLTGSTEMDHQPRALEFVADGAVREEIRFATSRWKMARLRSILRKKVNDLSR
jgi:hypothetical protein